MSSNHNAPNGPIQLYKYEDSTLTHTHNTQSKLKFNFFFFVYFSSTSNNQCQINSKTITENIERKRLAADKATVCMTAEVNSIKMAFFHFKFENTRRCITLAALIQFYTRTDYYENAMNAMNAFNAVLLCCKYVFWHLSLSEHNKCQPFRLLNVQFRVANILRKKKTQRNKFHTK